MKLYAYQKKDGLTPPSLSDSKVATELCEVDGRTFVSVDEKSVDVRGMVEVTGANFGDELPEIIERIKAASPSVRTIREQVIAKIRERYTVDDEIYLLRTAPSAEAAAWNDYVEECRSWGREQKALLGL